MCEQIVEYKREFNFSIKLDELEPDKVLVSAKHNIGHLFWSFKMMKYIPAPARHNRRRFIRYCIQFERQIDGIPAEFKFDAYLDTSVITKPDRTPEHDYQYSWSCESLRFDSAKNEQSTWHSEWRWLNLEELKNPVNKFLDDHGKLHLWARVEMMELSNYGRADKSNQLTVNGRIFNVNKYILAGHSPYFRTFFFKDGFKEFLTQTFEIVDNEVDTDLFGRMLDIIMSQEQYELDDETVEGLLLLADKYDFACVKEICEKFLTTYSNKPKIFKFRMAEMYGLVSLKYQTLRQVDPQEFCANFKSNVDEFNKLGETSKRTWDRRMADISKPRACKRRCYGIAVQSPADDYHWDRRAPTTRSRSQSRSCSRSSDSTYSRSSIQTLTRSRSNSYQPSESSIYNPPSDASFSA